MTEKKTWEQSDPKLWAAVTEAFGPDWINKTFTDLNETMKSRAEKNLCAWCGKVLGEDVMVSPMFPSVGPFCSSKCGDFDLRFYCLAEGK